MRTKSRPQNDSIFDLWWGSYVIAGPPQPPHRPPQPPHRPPQPPHRPPYLQLWKRALRHAQCPQCIQYWLGDFFFCELLLHFLVYKSSISGFHIFTHCVLH